MSLKQSLTTGAAVSALSVCLTGVAVAQETSSAIRGTVVGPDGAPVAGTPVTVTDTRTGAARTVTTTNDGVFFARGLRIGGPYTVTAESGRFANTTVSDIFLDLGDTYSVVVALEGGRPAADEIVITASAARSFDVALGPNATFTLEELQTLPAINRDIRDIIRTDPRVFIDEGFVDAVQCAGANPRFNSLTVDGIRLNDGFGLNSNGFPTERIPFSFDAIEQVAVELSPFDVEYGGFTACNINAVTKSGTNEISGSAFFDYTSDTFTGDSLEGSPVNVADFDEIRWGVNVGLPIIKDRLFLFGAYEKLSGANTFDRGPEGSGAVQPVVGFTQADFDRIQQISRDVYGYDPGGAPGSFDNRDEKILIKLDANITEDHRFAFTFNHNDGFNITESDSDADEFEFENHLYERGARLNAFAGSLYSTWTDNFSTEVRLAYADLDNRQIPIGGTDFGEVQIDVGDNIVYLGADDSRHANQLNYEVFNVKAKGDYQWREHLFTFGYEREQFDIFNLFIQEAEGEYRFSSIDDFEAGTPNRITYENAAGTNNIQDGAAEFGYAVNTFYIQDEFLIPDFDLTLTAGLRYDIFTTNDAPAFNQDFQDEFGFRNDATLDGESLIQPRFGFQWEASPAVSVRGGFGLYSGGNPNVWLSNNYSNNGVTLFEEQDRTLDDGLGDTLFTIPFTGEGRPIFDIPQNLFDAVANAQGEGPVNALDPDFEIPREWKFSVGSTWLVDVPLPILGGEYTLNADFLYTKQEEAAIVKNLDIEVVGTGPAGEPIYAGGTSNYLLTNSDGGRTYNVSASIAKEYDFGFDWTLGYAYSDAQDINPMTSSVAFSNHNNIAYVDPNNPAQATSNFNIKHRVTFVANYREAFFGDYFTTFSLFGAANQGSPFSYTFTANSLTGFFPFQDADSSLLYVPTGPNDPLVQFAPGFDQEAFFSFVEREGLDQFAGGFTDRNAFDGDWWTKFDLRIEQQFPGVLQGHKSAAFFIIENVGNLINDEWGILREASFPGTVNAVDASYSDDNSQYVFEEFTDPVAQGRVGRGASLWSIRLGVRYEF